MCNSKSVEIVPEMLVLIYVTMRYFVVLWSKESRVVDTEKERTNLREHVVAYVVPRSRPVPAIDDLNIQAESCVCIETGGKKWCTQAMDMTLS